MGSCISREIHERENSQENLVYYEEKMSTNEIQRLGSLYSHEGSKGLNQDAAIVHQGYGMKDGALCGVFDGHGKNGHIVSKFVRNKLPSLLLNQKNALTKVNTVGYGCNFLNHNEKAEGENLPNKDFNKWEEACVNAFKVMDKEIKLIESLDCSCSGTTAVVVIRQGEDLVIANLGDSRAVMGTITNEDGVLRAVQLTTDLKPGLPREAERIRKSNGRVIALKEEPHIQRVWLPHLDSPGLAMSRAFGDFLLKNHGIIAIPDVSLRHLTSNDQFLVLATDGGSFVQQVSRVMSQCTHIAWRGDGYMERFTISSPCRAVRAPSIMDVVWDVLSNNEVVSIVSAEGNEEAAARAVVEAAVSAWKQKFPSSKRDDCTVVCLFLQKMKRLKQTLV